jgi:hypothetical protein
LSYEGYVDQLLLLIKEKRDSLIAVANQTGYISEQTVKCSQDLDKLIYKYQEMIFEKNPNKKTVLNERLEKLNK